MSNVDATATSCDEDVHIHQGYLNVLTLIVGLQTTQWENANNAAIAGMRRNTSALR